MSTRFSLRNSQARRVRVLTHAGFRPQTGQAIASTPCDRKRTGSRSRSEATRSRKRLPPPQPIIRSRLNRLTRWPRASCVSCSCSFATCSASGKGWPMLRLAAAILRHPRRQHVRPGAAQRVERRLLRRDREAGHGRLSMAARRLPASSSRCCSCSWSPQTWLQERLKIRLRERLTQVAARCLAQAEPRLPARASSGETGAQPDQRMQEDCRLFSELTTELGVGMLQAFLLLVSFIGVLWALSGPMPASCFGGARDRRSRATWSGSRSAMPGSAPG